MREIDDQTKHINKEKKRIAEELNKIEAQKTEIEECWIEIKEKLMSIDRAKTEIDGKKMTNTHNFDSITISKQKRSVLDSKLISDSICDNNKEENLNNNHS